MKTINFRTSLVIIALALSIAAIARAEEPTEKELQPLVKELTRSGSLGVVPARPMLSQIKSVEVKITKIDGSEKALDHKDGKVVAEYQVWPVHVFAVVGYNYAGQDTTQKGEGTYYAYQGPAHNGVGVSDSSHKWTVTATPPEIKKSSIDLIRESLHGKDKKP